MAAKLVSNLFLAMIDIVHKRWRSNLCKDCSLPIFAKIALLHRMRFRPCQSVPDVCLKPTFQIRVQTSAHFCGRGRAACDLNVFHGLRHFCICLPSPAPAPARSTKYNLWHFCAIISYDFKSISSFDMPNLREIGPTQLHLLGGPLNCTCWVDQAGCGPN